MLSPLKQFTRNLLVAVLSLGIAFPPAFAHAVNDPDLASVADVTLGMSLTTPKPEGHQDLFDKALFDYDARLAAQGGGSVQQKVITFNEWIERLKHNVFAQGSADPESRYYVNHPLDAFALVGQTVFKKGDDRPLFDPINPKRVTVEVLDTNGQTVQYLNPEGKDLTYLHGEKGRLGPEGSFNRTDDMQLNTFALSYQGQRFMEFKNNVQSLGIFNGFLVYLDPSRISQERGIAVLSFIDLNYFMPALGKEALPIFRLPVKLSDEALKNPSDLQLQRLDDGFRIDGKTFSGEVIEFFADFQRLFYNVQVSLVNPDLYTEMGPAISEVTELILTTAESRQKNLQEQFQRAGVTDDLVRSFLKTAQNESALSRRVQTKGLDKESAELSKSAVAEVDKVILDNLSDRNVWDPEKIDSPLALNDEERREFRKSAVSHLNFSEETKNSVLLAQTFQEQTATAAVLKQMTDSLNADMEAEHKITNRIRLLWARMTLAQPLGSAEITRALGLVAAGLSTGNQWSSSGAQGYDRLAEITRTVLGSRHGQIVTAAAIGGLSALLLPQETAQFYYAALEVGQTFYDSALGWTAATWNHAAFTWQKSWAWLNWQKVYDTLLSPTQLPKLGVGISAMLGGLFLAAGTVHTIVNSIHFYRHKVKSDYGSYREQGYSRLGAIKQAFVDHMTKEKKTYYKLLGDAEAKKMGEKSSAELTAEQEAELSKTLEALKRDDERHSRMVNTLKNLPIINRFFSESDGKIENLRGALIHFFVGFSTWTHTNYAFLKTWNPWFLVRNFYLAPRAWMSMLLYPNLFNRTVRGAKGGHFGTVYNGGYRPFYETTPFLMLTGEKNVRATMKAVAEWERSVIPAEQKLNAAAMKLAFKRIIEMAPGDPELAEFVKGGPVKSYAEGRVQRLQNKYRIYFRAYYTELFQRSMKTMMQQKYGLTVDPEQSDRSVKSAALAQENSVTLTNEEAEAIVQAEAANPQVDAYAQRTAFDFVKGFFQRQKVKHFEKVERAMDPKFKFALNRYLKADEKSKDPEAMARATRHQMVGLITDKPSELIFSLLFAVGIDQGILKPIGDQMFSEDHLFYLSRMTFWNGYVVGIVMGMLAEVWMKVQMDARLDDMDAFENVPDKAQTKKGYFRYLWSQTFHKENTWWKQQMWSMKLSLMNLPAYFATAVLTNALTLGRWDMDYFAMTIFGMMLPIAGLYFKMDQGFELSNKFDLGKFPQWAWSDSRVQEYRAKKMGVRKVWFKIFENALFNVTGNVIGNFELMTSPGLGPRSFTRLLFGGYLPSELVVNYALRPVGDLIGGPVKRLTDACEFALTNNHTDAIRIPKR